MCEHNKTDKNGVENKIFKCIRIMILFFSYSRHSLDKRREKNETINLYRLNFNVEAFHATQYKKELYQVNKRNSYTALWYKRSRSGVGAVKYETQLNGRITIVCTQ